MCCASRAQRRGTATSPASDRWRSSVANPLEKLLRAGEGRILRRLQQVVKAVNALEEDYAQLTDEELRGETAELRARHEAGESLDKLMPEAFAAVREAAKRTLGPSMALEPSAPLRERR